MEVDNQPMPRVNGNMLANYVDQKVLIVAELMSIENLKMKIKCCDGSIILVNLQEPISTHLEGGTIVQIQAIPKSKNVVGCNDFIVLANPSNDFSLEMYNNAVKNLAETTSDNTYLISDVTVHWGADNEKEINLVDGSDLAAQNTNGNGTQNGNQTGSQGAGDNTFY